MEKIKLKDGTQIGILSITSNSITFDSTIDKDFVIESLTERNLSSYQVLNTDDEVMSVLGDKKVIYPYYVSKESFTVNLVDVDLTEKRIRELEETVDVLVMESLGV